MTPDRDLVISVRDETFLPIPRDRDVAKYGLETELSRPTLRPCFSLFLMTSVQENSASGWAYKLGSGIDITINVPMSMVQRRCCYT
jgi:hypothetical protein